MWKLVSVFVFVLLVSAFGDDSLCATNNGGCGANAACYGGYGGGAVTCVCNNGFYMIGSTCVAVNACATNNGGCASLATCTTTLGTYSVSCACPDGYTGNGYYCAPPAVNLCATNNGGCDVNAACYGGIGGGAVSCVCNTGYYKTSEGGPCVAVNACATNNGGCDTHAVCSTTLATWDVTCTCSIGFIGNGWYCAQAEQLQGLSVLANDGGAWIAYPTASGCGFFHLYVTKQGETGLREVVNTGADLLPDGTTTYAVLGTGGNGVGTTQWLDLSISGVAMTVQNHASTTTTILGKAVTVSFEFANSNDPAPGQSFTDIIATCGTYPDGYTDSYGTVSITIGNNNPAPLRELESLGVFANDGGGWIAYPTASGCGIFHLYVTKQGETGLREVVNTGADLLPDGTTTYAILGTGGNGVGTTQRLDLTISGVAISVQNHGSSTTTILGKTITVSFEFANSNDPAPGQSFTDVIATCGVYPDGYTDSYGTVTITVGTPFDCNVGATVFDWTYNAPQCNSLTVNYPTGLGAGQTNDANIRISWNGGANSVTLNFHSTVDFTGTVVFDIIHHANFPSLASGTAYTVEWVQVGGSNCHWSGHVSCTTN